LATHSKAWRRDGEVGTFYRFDRAGDGIPMHAHAFPQLLHDTRVLRGSVEIYGDMQTILLEHGDTAQFPSFRMHEIVALQDGTEIVNVLKFPTAEQAAYTDDTETAQELTLLGKQAAYDYVN
jgi:quercetin dioxygenase-like cupin family protein